MSGVQSSLLPFPGPGARGSRLVALWVTEMESCQGYHDGTVKYGWLAASCSNNAAEQRMLVGVVPVEPVPDRVSIVGRRASINRRAAQGSAAWLLVPFGCPVGSTDRTSSARAGSGRTEKAGRWTEHGTKVAKWEAGKANGPWEGCWSHPQSGPRAGPRSIGRVLGGKGPLPGLRYQDARAGRRGCTLLCPA